jgi:hypothetical protein
MLKVSLTEIQTQSIVQLHQVYLLNCKASNSRTQQYFSATSSHRSSITVKILKL